MFRAAHATHAVLPAQWVTSKSRGRVQNVRAGAMQLRLPGLKPHGTP